MLKVPEIIDFITLKCQVVGLFEQAHSLFYKYAKAGFAHIEWIKNAKIKKCVSMNVQGHIRK